MSIKVKVTKNIAGHKAGDTIEVTPKVADYLTSIGAVEEKKTAPKPKAEPKSTTPDPSE